jgi:hypothetical protein
MSPSRLKPFEYFEPATVEEAVDRWNTHGDTARVREMPPTPERILAEIKARGGYPGALGF